MDHVHYVDSMRLLITTPTVLSICHLLTLTFYNPTNTNSGTGEFGCNTPCGDGFSRNAVGSCEDVNECLGSPCAGANQVCVNIEGSFLCDCDVGFKFLDDACTSDTCENFPSLCAAGDECVFVEGRNYFHLFGSESFHAPVLRYFYIPFINKIFRRLHLQGSLRSWTH